MCEKRRFGVQVNYRKFRSSAFIMGNDLKTAIRPLRGGAPIKGTTELCQICRVGQNHMYTVYIRYFLQGNHQIYGHIWCIYTVLANPTNRTFHSGAFIMGNTEITIGLCSGTMGGNFRHCTLCAVQAQQKALCQAKGGLKTNKEKDSPCRQ